MSLGRASHYLMVVPTIWSNLVSSMDVIHPMIIWEYRCGRAYILQSEGLLLWLKWSLDKVLSHTFKL